MITLACLKTSIGLITSISETFETMSHGRCSYWWWAVGFSLFSFGIANLGLNKIIEYSIPVLMLLYPLVITLILLSLFGKFFQYSQTIFKSVTAFTVVAAFFDFIKALPENVQTMLELHAPIEAATHLLPLYSIGLGWMLPAFLGLALGLFLARHHPA